MAVDRPRPRERPLRRRVGTRRPRKTFLVFCEGARTEPEYLNALKLLPAVRDVAAVDLQVGPGHGVPKTLVTRAIEARSRAIEEDAEIDEFWCVFDVEWPKNHPRLQEAIEEAALNDVHVAVSNPCFELWLILHFQDQAEWLNNAEARRLRSDLDGSSNKGLDPERYMPLVRQAARRAAELDEQHRRSGTRFPRTNPSSSMHRLLTAIEPDGLLKTLLARHYRDWAAESGSPAESRVRGYHRAPQPLGQGNVARVVGRQVVAQLPDAIQHGSDGVPGDGKSPPYIESGPRVAAAYLLSGDPASEPAGHLRVDEVGNVYLLL